MPILNLGKSSKCSRPINATAAGTSAVNGSTVDMTGFDSVLFIAAIGTLTATQVTSLKAQGGAASNGSDAADITGANTSAMADGDSNKLLVLDVVRPQFRYVRPVVVRGTANAVVDGCVAIQYNIAGRSPLQTQDTTVSQIAGVYF